MEIEEMLLRMKYIVVLYRTVGRLLSFINNVADYDLITINKHNLSVWVFLFGDLH